MRSALCVSRACRALRLQARGMTLIELLVAMVIGLGLTLAVSSMVIVGENHKRTNTSTNDAEQTGAYAFYALDKALRGAGSGFADSAYPADRGVLSCRLNVTSNGTTILPRTTAFPAPFNTKFLVGAGASATAFLANLRMTPLLIAPGASDGGSDVLVVMGGSGSAGGVPRQITNSGGGANLLPLDNTLGFAKDDLLLVSQSGPADCLLEEVTADPTGSSTLALAATGVGKYYTLGGSTPTPLAALAVSTSSYVTPLGNAAANNVQFQLFGVGAGRTLYSYDLLQNLKLAQGSGALDAVQAIADGVDQMYAIYGIDSSATADGKWDTWANPDVASGFDIGTVMTTPAKMRQILSVRVAVVLRGSYYDKNNGIPVSPATLTLFRGLSTTTGGTAIPRIINLSPTDQQYRYRVFEFTVPLRNMLMLAAAQVAGT